jgi:hypothetical protein
MIKMMHVDNVFEVFIFSFSFLWLNFFISIESQAVSMYIHVIMYVCSMCMYHICSMCVYTCMYSSSFLGKGEPSIVCLVGRTSTILIEYFFFFTAKVCFARDFDQYPLVPPIPKQ